MLNDVVGFPGGSVVENPPASAGDAGLIPWLGRPLEEEMATHSRTLAGIFPRTEEPGSYSPCSRKESGTTE